MVKVIAKDEANNSVPSNAFNAIVDHAADPMAATVDLLEWAGQNIGTDAHLPPHRSSATSTPA